ncbi:hypothetical protein [Amycolatopsis sp. NBC_01480]|uniref:hypothetical protein n=1 Tax=Amycolatopsis sp. NBC_01480 TaxID=2903562 RepID=UPI002E28A703|nr:hypothetical protein [Amycolatopsis sp. NBC_01480]
MTVIAGNLSAAEVDAAMYAVHRWEPDNRNHLFKRDQDGAGVGAVWPKCTRGKPIPQRTCFPDELSPELGDDRDHSQDCRSCFPTGSRQPWRP